MSLDLDKSTWKRVVFGDVVRNLNVTVKDPSAEGIDQVIAMEHLDPCELKISRWGSIEDGTTFTRRVRPGQTLFGKRRAYQRKAAYAEFDAITSGDILVFEADPTQLLSEFLPFLVQSDGFYDHALGTSAGSLSPRTNWRDLSNYEFDLPPLDEQKRLADLLWSVERHRLAVVESKVNAAAAADAYFSETLAKHAAESVPAPDLIDEMTVGVVVRPTQYYTDDRATGVPALRGLNVLPGGFDLTDLVYFRPESAADLQKSTLQKDDVVVIRTGRPGDAAVVPAEVAGYNCIDLIIVRPGRHVDSKFVELFLNSDYGRAQIARRSAGTAQQHFNVGAFKKIQIPALPLNEQRALVSATVDIQSVSDRFADELDRLEAVRAAMLNNIFRGAK
ncbi:restriction endonuclease subunit S [Streptomyces sp. Babs14]|uniref:restriction endonuclease subunit S n=1 Tax=unclassified Streptomyces TaxID=2593676 RepID=UPI001C23EED0|nr:MULTISPECIES: restriction endonuclease subunit S [unclassified Streptomyces]MBU8549430.1 restriction endonuclease subunit S [Streptomyces sp. Osf17]MBU8556208.1 restriction endonuclease subunit S [Streptomyces sp. Babs14]